MSLRLTILSALQNTLVPDLATIKQATAQLSALKSQQGFCSNLMEITDDSTLHCNIRQASLALLQNTIRYGWRQSPLSNNNNFVQISSSEKHIICNTILKAIVRCNRDNKFLPIYKNIVKMIIEVDHQNWLPIQECLAALKSGVEGSISDPNIIPSVLHFIMSVVRGFEKYTGTSREYLQRVEQKLFPALLQIAAGFPTPENLFLIVKTYYKSVACQIGHISKIQTLQWMPLIKQVIEASIPGTADSISLDFKKYSSEFYFFNSKKWAMRTVLKFVQRHANPLYDTKYKAFSEQWYSHFGQEFAETLIQQLQVKTIPKAKYFGIKALICIVQLHPELVIPQATNMMFNILPLFLKLTPADEELARQDPVEFLRKEDDPVQNYTNVKLVATDLWMRLCCIGLSGKPSKKKESKNGRFINQGINFLKTKLASPDLLQREMAMYLICKFRTQLMEMKQIKQALPILIANYVIPEFKNQQMFLRARAVELFTDFGLIQYPDKQVLRQALEGVYTCLMKDPHTIVKVKAACSFNCIIKHEQAIEWVKPYLADILTVYLQLLEKFDFQNLVLSLEGIVNTFTSEIAPFAVKLVQHLCSIFLKYARIDLEKTQEKEYDGQVEMAAAGCLQTVRTILASPLPDSVFPQIESFLLQTLMFAFTNEGLDYTGDAVKTLSFYLYRVQVISREMWFFYPVIMYSMIGLDPKTPTHELPTLNQAQQAIFRCLKSESSLEYLQEASVCLRNFVFKAKDIILTQVDFFGNNLVELLFKLADAVYKQNHHLLLLVFRTSYGSLGYKPIINSLIRYLLQNLSQPESLIPLVARILKRNFDEEDSALSYFNVELVCICLYVAPSFVKQLQAGGLFDKLIHALFVVQKKLYQQNQKQRVILGLSAILRQYSASQRIGSSIPQLLKLLFRLVESVHDIRKTAIHKAEANDSQGDQQQSEKESSEGMSEDGDDDAEDCGWNEEQNYESCLEKIDQIEYFQRSLQLIHSADPALYGRLLSEFKTEELQNLNKWIIQCKEEFKQRMNNCGDPKTSV